MAAPTTNQTNYKKLRDGSWGLIGPADLLRQHQRVTVTKRSGERKSETVGRVLWTGDGKAIATIARGGHGGGRRGGRGYVSGICGSCGHDEDACADQDCVCRDCGGMMR